MVTDVRDEELDTPQPEPTLLDDLIIPVAQVQDAHVTRKSNGATYVVVFEVPLEYLQEIADAGDGHTVFFKGKELGAGADIRRIGISKDADNNRHVKLAFQFAQSEVKKSLGWVGTMIVGDGGGSLRISPMYKQQGFDLTSRAE